MNVKSANLDFFFCSSNFLCFPGCFVVVKYMLMEQDPTPLDEVFVPHDTIAQTQVICIG